MKIYNAILLLIGVFLGYATALPFFDNFSPYHRLGLTPPVRPPQPKQPQQLFDNDGIFDTNAMFAPANLGVGVPQEQKAKIYVSSSASDYDSTPSDGGGDTNPTLPTLGPGGSPTQAPKVKGPGLITNGSVGGVTAGVILGLALIVGIAVAVAVYIIKKKG